MSEEIRNFKRALFHRYFEEHDGFIEIRFICKDSGTCISKFYRYDEFDDSVIKEIQRLNVTNNVYFGVNPRPLDKGRKKTDIKDIICLWADVDGKDFEKGKEEAHELIQKFPKSPNIIVDSGHGYHCYWFLKEPIIEISEEGRINFKQILSGIVSKLKADKHPLFLNCLLRLPGTFNIKKEEVKECKIIYSDTDGLYSLEDFSEFRNVEYKESIIDTENFPEFGSKELILNRESLHSAKSDLKKLEIDSKTKKRIITGAHLTAKNADKTRSGRDMSIICSLIYYDYNYPTIKSIFFNPFLGCSNRIREKGELALQWDIRRALDFVKERSSDITPEMQKILEIKRIPFISKEEKLRRINKFITEDLISGKNPAGYGYRDNDRRLFYYFDKKEKRLMDIEGIDFYCFIRIRYGIQRKDYEEIKDAIKAEIWDKGTEIESHIFAYFNEKNYILYVSDHNNGIYKLDGERIQYVDNGTDGVFFEFNSDFTPFNIDVNNLRGINYFERGESRSEFKLKILRTQFTIKTGKRKLLGFNWTKFCNGDSYLCKFLIDRTNFACESEKDLTAEEQKMLLVTYFYSLFFESMLTEKPIICFVGRKESGKSTLATSIGKILFGDKFQSRHCPENLNDLNTIIGENYYMVFDNVDHFVRSEIIDALCIAATGGTVERRKLYTDREVVKIRPHIFLGITTREAKFRRDDLVSRLLLFNTMKISRPKPKRDLYRAIEEYRNKIMAEVLVNLNTIIELLKSQETYSPECISRIADWEAFGRKVNVGFPWGFYFRFIMESMNEEKDKFAIEDDTLYSLLEIIVISEGKPIEEKSASELYKLLQEKAEELKMRDFTKRYKNPNSMAKRLANIKDELNRVFDFNTHKARSNMKLYSFSPLTLEEEKALEEPTVKLGVEEGKQENLNLEGDIIPAEIDEVEQLTVASTKLASKNKKAGKGDSKSIGSIDLAEKLARIKAKHKSGKKKND